MLLAMPLRHKSVTQIGMCKPGLNSVHHKLQLLSQPHNAINRSWPYWRHHKRMQLYHKKEGENSDIQLLSSQYFSFVNFKREISNFSFFLSAKPHYSFGDRRWLQFLSNTSSIQYLIEVSGVNSIHQGLVVQKVIDLIQD